MSEQSTAETTAAAAAAAATTTTTTNNNKLSATSSSSSSKSKDPRVRFDDDCGSSTHFHDPQTSAHWHSLSHHPNDVVIASLPELVTTFQSQLVEMIAISNSEFSPKGARYVAVWSCVAGYMEALSTHKQIRYSIFPLPLQALERLVEEEWVSFVRGIEIPTTTASSSSSKGEGDNNNNNKDSSHRRTVRAMANAIWAKVLPKAHIRDELHANSLYVGLRGREIENNKKSLDCFGAALLTICACHLRGLTNSRLVLSEDHAYEQHALTLILDGADGRTTTTTTIIGTCEVAVPGSTKLAQSKRGRPIEETLKKDSASKTSSFSNSGTGGTGGLTPETSWLYMAAHPVVCDTLPMMLVAILANVNCWIDKPKGTIVGNMLASGQLYEVKRDMLWVLYDHGHMDRFPFGLLELGDCEEHRGSTRSEQWVTVPDIDEPILMNEKLYHQAIQVNKEVYNNSQAYPYFYAGHYHKDAGNEGPEHEYRLVHAIKQYADAANVASQYYYEGIDSMQLNKHMTAAAQLIAQDILTKPQSTAAATAAATTTSKPREWNSPGNAIAVGTWLLSFFDSLLYWEEASGSKQFVEILNPTHKHFIGKLFMMLAEPVRKEVLTRVLLTPPPGTTNNSNLPQFRQVRSKRLAAVDGLLVQALQKSKVSIREMELTIPCTDDSLEGGGARGRRSKRIKL